MVSAKSFKPYGVCSVVNPYQKEIIFNMTFHASFIDAMEFMWAKFSRDTPFLFKMLGDGKKSLHLRGIM